MPDPTDDKWMTLNFLFKKKIMTPAFQKDKPHAHLCAHTHRVPDRRPELKVIRWPLGLNTAGMRRTIISAVTKRERW